MQLCNVPNFSKFKSVIRSRSRGMTMTQASDASLAPRPQPAKTALMLNGGTLDGIHLTVTSDSVKMDEPDSHSDHDHASVEQSDKPRAGSMSLNLLLWG